MSFWWVWLVAYLVSFTITYRATYTYDHERVIVEKDGSEWHHNAAYSKFLGTVAGVLSPIIFPLMIFYRLATPETKRDREERQAQVKKEIAELHKTELKRLHTEEVRLDSEKHVLLMLPERQDEHIERLAQIEARRLEIVKERELYQRE